MQRNYNSISWFLLIVFLSGAVFADDDAELNAIYRVFFDSPVSLEEIGALYRDDVIHVGRPSTELIRGKPNFLETNIAPLVEMVNQGHIKISGIAYIVRRIIVGDMANDVGYLHMTVKKADGESVEQLQKFSWVFVRMGRKWRVVTDFDATPAPLALLDNLKAEFIVK